MPDIVPNHIGLPNDLKKNSFPRKQRNSPTIRFSWFLPSFYISSCQFFFAADPTAVNAGDVPWPAEITLRQSAKTCLAKSRRSRPKILTVYLRSVAGLGRSLRIAWKIPLKPIRPNAAKTASEIRLRIARTAALEESWLLVSDSFQMSSLARQENLYDFQNETPLLCSSWSTSQRTDCFPVFVWNSVSSSWLAIRRWAGGAAYL